MALIGKLKFPRNFIGQNRHTIKPPCVGKPIENPDPVQPLR